MSFWHVYMLRCNDGSYYTGVTTDLKRRIREHNGDLKGNKGAKYTKTRRPVEIVYSEQVINRSVAEKQEAKIRRLSRIEKEKIAKL